MVIQIEELWKLRMVLSKEQLHLSTISAFCSRQGAKYSIIFMANPINFLSSRVQREAIFSVSEDSISECSSCYMVSLNKQRQDKLETFLARIGARHRSKRLPHSTWTQTRTHTQSLPLFTFSLSQETSVDSHRVIKVKPK